MPYLQPATNNYFGFMPALVGDSDFRTTNYLVSSSCATIFKNDLVGLSSDGFVTPWLPGSSPFVGVAANAVVAGDGSTGADFRVASSKTVLVYDDPNMMFVGCDTTSGLIGGHSFGSGSHITVLATGAAGVSNNTTLMQSIQALSGLTASTGPTLDPFTLITVHPVETAFSTLSTGQTGSASAVRKWIVQPFHHAYALKTTST